VTCAGDVLELFDLEPHRTEPPAISEAATAVLTKLRDGALTGDELVRSAGVEPGAASAALVELELTRHVVLEDGVYRVCV
jgi:predicted Rossmann fold nucleotide-binding protein DprA/Smf involved in DNA uptake